MWWVVVTTPLHSCRDGSIEVHPSEYYHIASWGADRPHSISAEMSPKLEYSIVLEADCPCNAHCQITLSTPHDRCNR
ncbi:hypothetical protein HYQ45_015636 [Verticillium longisporum]|uniref:Uncharacterized protein n=1 Tax=Verticillium longisporum TaxID=100787 RepID=A0A8I2ZAC9_VERLO|nr:hypothetical protein HYQ45_015636 [Verticillium longisporum]KAG7147610.1 hypothetical protein HYQ46_003526 [Verticillium longisporum]